MPSAGNARRIERFRVTTLWRFRAGRSLCVLAGIAIAFALFCGELAAQPVPAALPPPDPSLQEGLQHILQALHLNRAVQEKRLAVSLVDVTRPTHPRYAGVNDRHMMYAASLPKIAILLAGFEAIQRGAMQYNSAVREMFTRLARFSSNTDASRAIQAIGFPFIAQVLTSARYRLYDIAANGGLWLGKAYGGPNDYWKRDPLHNISHGATSLQVARYFYMLENGLLVDERWSAEIKRILSQPAIRHKFVLGLSRLPGRVIYRKSGTWKDSHCDAALVEYNGRKYIAVALMKDSRGPEILPRLIVEMDQLILSTPAVPPQEVTALPPAALSWSGLN